jgi:hypothetical protein
MVRKNNYYDPLIKNEGINNFNLTKIKATMGFEPMMRVLQTLALPLGHVAMDNKDYKIREKLCQSIDHVIFRKL